MIVFILCNLLLAMLVQNQSNLLLLLATPLALGVGLAVMAVSLSAGYLKKAPTVIWHDAFASSCLLAWYAGWAPLFNDDAPMFFFFPLYYALFTSVVTLFFINKSQYFDQESVAQLRYLEKISRLDISATVILVLVSLLIPRHYALYPIAMTLFIIRHTITACLEIIDRQ